MTGPEVTAPTKVCPHCGAQAQTLGDRCPNCKKPYKQKRGRSFMKVLLAVVLGGLVLIVGCVALIGAGINEGVEEAEKEQDAKGITMSEFRSIKQGTTQDDVESQLGPPEDSQEFENQIPELQDQPARSSCIYYPEKGKPLFEGRSFQFCFDEGKLTSKNAY